MNYLSAHRDSEKEGDHSWGERAKILSFFFKKLTKYLINGKGLIKELWANLGQFSNMGQYFSIWKYVMIW